MLEVGSEVTASSGTSVVLASGATAGDELNVYAFSTFNLADVYTKAQSDAKYVDLTSNQSIAGNKNFAGNTLYVDDTNDRVGVGTNNPLQKLDISGNAVRLTNGSYTAYVGSQSTLNGSGGASDFTVRSDNDLTFSSGGPYERMRIDSSGRVTMPAQPSFHAHRTAGDYTASSPTTYVFNNVSYNNGSHYSTSTGRFTAPVSGYYIFSYNVLGRGLTSGGRTAIYVNGNKYISVGGGSSQTYVGSTGEMMHSATVQMLLSANDFVDVRVWTAGTGDFYGDANGHNGFSGHLIG
jgi:hypothetical protein